MINSDRFELITNAKFRIDTIFNSLQPNFLRKMNLKKLNWQQILYLKNKKGAIKILNPL